LFINKSKLKGFLNNIMQVFNISASDAKLPSTARWIQPNYAGQGDLIIRPERDNPADWKEKFPDYNWKLTILDDLKPRIAESLCKVEKLVSNTKFNATSTALNPFNPLLRGIVIKEYGSDRCTAKWMKMIELSSLLKPLFQYTEQKRTRELNTFHLNEATGDFITALNHILKTTYKIDWTWRATALDDAISHVYPKNIINTFGDGGSESNCRRIAFNLSKTRIDLITCGDLASFDSMLTVIAVLSKSGAVVLRWSNRFDSCHISWLWLMNCLFKELTLVKPESSDPDSNEIYVIGLDYKPIKEEYIENLYTYLRFIKSIKHDCPALFRKNDIPEEFISKIVEAQRLLIVRECESIDQKYDSCMHYKNFTPSQIHEAMSAEHQYISSNWLERNGLLMLSKNDSLDISI
jgi:hypothetical protein